MARLYQRRNANEILELFLRDPLERAPMVRALAAHTLERGLEALEGWLPPTPFVETWFEPESRAKTLPMVRGAANACATARFWGSDYF